MTVGVDCHADAEVPPLEVGVASQLVRRQRGDDAAVRDHDDLVGEGQRHAEVLLHHEQVHAFVAQAATRLDELVHDDGGEALRRFVHDQEPRLGHECPGHRQHLLLAPRETARSHGSPFFEAGEQPVHPGEVPSHPREDTLKVLLDSQGAEDPPAWGT